MLIRNMLTHSKTNNKDKMFTLVTMSDFRD